MTDRGVNKLEEKYSKKVINESSSKHDAQVDETLKEVTYFSVAANQNPANGLGLSQEFDRNKYDDVRRRIVYKKRQFKNKKTIEDPYSGKTLHLKEKAALRKYGKQRYQEHATNVDHITPLKRIYDRGAKNPFLNDSDLRLLQI